MSFDVDNKREFERYNISLSAEVGTLDDHANDHSEMVMLQDISGGGARFTTSHPDYYTIGQKIDVTIKLPGSNAMHAKFEGVGRVVWMGELDENETSIGVCMDDLLVFEHIVDGSV